MNIDLGQYYLPLTELEKYKNTILNYLTERSKLTIEKEVEYSEVLDQLWFDMKPFQKRDAEEWSNNLGEVCHI